MKKITLILFVLTCGLVAQTTKVGGSGTTKVGGSGTTKVSPVVAASTYLLQEDFTTGSGTTPPSGWTIPAGGTYTYSNVSPALPQGGNNFKITDASPDYTYASFTGQTECWAYFQFQTSSLSGSTNTFELQDASNVRQCFVRVATDGTVQIWDSNFEALATVGAMVVNTNYQVWVHYKAGAGTGVIDVGFSTNGTRPTSGSNFAQVTGTTTTATVSKVALVARDNSTNQYFDHVLINNSQIGDSP